MFDNSIHVASRLSARQIIAGRIHAIILDESREMSGREPLYEPIDDMGGAGLTPIPHYSPTAAFALHRARSPGSHCPISTAAIG